MPPFFFYSFMPDTKQQGGWGGILSFLIAGHFPGYFSYSNSGLETMFAGAILAGALLAFYQQRSSRTVFLLCTLLILTKHHFYAVATVLAGSEAWLRIWHSPQEKKKILRDLFFYYLLPATGFIVFCWIYFGNVIPNSLYAKIFFHPKESGGYPYFRYFMSSLYAFPSAVSLLPLIGLAFSWVLTRKALSLRFGILLIVAGILEMQVMLLRKQEIHDWYFMDGFLALQIVSILAVIEIAQRLGTIPSAKKVSLRLGLLLILHLSFYFVTIDPNEHRFHVRNLLKSHLLDYREFLTVLESEKRDIGRYLKKQGTPEQSVVIAHGWPAYDSGMKALDMTGINSKETLALHLDRIRILETFEPDFVAFPAFNFSKLTARYQLLHISQNGYRYDKCIWQVWRKKPANQWLPFEKTRTIMPQLDQNQNTDRDYVTRKNSNVIEIRFDSDHPGQQIVFSPLSFRQSIAGMYCYMGDHSTQGVEWTAKATVSDSPYQNQIQLSPGEGPRMLSVGIPKENTGN